MRADNYKILLVDDESDILEFLGYNLRKEGFQVFEAINGKEAINLTKTENPHLILLDIMMPVMDGLVTCREINKLELSTKPLIIFLSAKSEDYLQTATMLSNADDYLTKPIKPQLLISRIKDVLNTNSTNYLENNPDIIGIDDLQINKLTNIITKNNQKFLLTKRQLEILFLLASSPDRIFKKKEIFEKVWGEDLTCNQIIIIDDYIRKIHDKTGIDNIKAINGDGYKFETKV